jgi:hypothetical protein
MAIATTATATAVSSILIPAYSKNNYGGSLMHKPHAVAANPIAFNNYLGGLGVQLQPGHQQNQQLMAAYALQQQQVTSFLNSAAHRSEH